MALEERYVAWDDKVSKQRLDGFMGVDDSKAHVLQNDINPQPRSGSQERLENSVNSYV